MFDEDIEDENDADLINRMFKGNIESACSNVEDWYNTPTEMTKEDIDIAIRTLFPEYYNEE